MTTAMGRPPRKVFCVGMNKTGTTSLESVLRDMGYRLGRQRTGERLLEDWTHGRYDRILDLARTADAFQDVPFSLPGTFKVLDAAFPGSRFILTVRESPRRWLESLERFTQKRLGLKRPVSADDLRRDPYVEPGWSWMLWRSAFKVDERRPFDPDSLVAAYLEHNESVVQHFRTRPGDLLVVDVSHRNAMSSLAEFLGRSTTETAMPRLNASSAGQVRDVA